MIPVAFSPAARFDLVEIASYIARDNPSRALSFVDELEAVAQQLGHQPGIGAPRFELRAGLRQVPHGRYLLLYTAHPDHVRVERVLHSARDIAALFADLP